MSDSALDRVARALDLIPFINANPGLSVAQIAERFGASPAQISKDLTLLHMCGLPGYSHLELLDIDYEDPDFISVLEPQVLNEPRSLTQIEALTLVLGLNILMELTNNQEEITAIAELQNKIKERYKDAEAINVSTSSAIVPSPFTQQISEAISHNQLLKISYNSATSDTINTRVIYPVTIRYLHGVGYLNALLLENREERTFRLDRIQSLEIYMGEEGLSMELKESESPVQMQEIELEMGGDGLFFIERHNEIVTSFTESAKGFQITLKVGGGEWITRTLISWPSKITVIKPLDLCLRVEERIASALRNYQ